MAGVPSLGQINLMQNLILLVNRPEGTNRFVTSCLLCYQFSPVILTEFCPTALIILHKINIPNVHG